MQDNSFPIKIINRSQLERLFQLIQSTGYQVIGPKVQDQTIVLEALDHFSQLPVGLMDDHKPGSYKLKKSSEEFFFSYTIGPHSPKNYLHPSKRRLWKVERNGEEWRWEGSEKPEKPFAFFGVRACDAAAIERMASVFKTQGSHSYFEDAVKGSITITATCLHPNEQCFCVSMDVGPQSQKPDIDLLELAVNGEHRFIVRCLSENGKDLIAKLDGIQDCDPKALELAEGALDRAINSMSKNMPPPMVQKSLSKKHDHPRWQEVADRCLSCGNCTMVCPTCFCTTVTDQNQLDGNHSERWLKWDSCFNEDFSYIHGGAIRTSVKSRYRQWLTHKIDHWHQQFGESGCVGCGRCTTWCPVGIDITEEVKELGKNP